MQSNKTQHSRKKKNGASAGQKQLSLGEVTSGSIERRFFNSEDRGRPARIRRRLTSVVTVTPGAGSPFFYGITSGAVTGALEWANLSASYQQFRVRAVQATIVPILLAGSTGGYVSPASSAAMYPGTIVTARYPSGSSASTFAALYGSGGAKVHSSNQKVIKMIATMEDNPDAAIFTDCNAGAPAALSQYGCQARGSFSASAALAGLAVPSHDVFVDWDVEFIARN